MSDEKPIGIDPQTGGIVFVKVTGLHTSIAPAVEALGACIARLAEAQQAVWRSSSNCDDSELERHYQLNEFIRASRIGLESALAEALALESRYARENDQT